MVIVLSLVATIFMGCVPKNTEKAKNKLEKKGYTIETVTFTELKSMQLLFDGLEDGIICYNEAKESGVMAYLFKDEKSAKNAESDFKKFLDEYAEGWGEFIQDNFKIEVKGKWILFGNDEGINAFKK